MTDEPILARRHAVPIAVHLFLIRDGGVLLLRRCNTGFEDGNYSVIAGHLDGGEQVHDAAMREAHEEAGVILSQDQLRVTGVMHRYAAGYADAERIDFFLVAIEWSGTVVNQEPHKCDDLSWFDLTALPPNVIPYVRAALDLGVDGLWFGSFGWNGRENG